MTNEELKALVDKITPGEWAVVWYPRTCEHRVETPDDFICSSVGEQDANFIAACSVEVLRLLEENAALTAEAKQSIELLGYAINNLKAAEVKIAELTAEQEKVRTALTNIGEYLEHSATADDWELDADTKSWIKECLEDGRR